MGCVPRRREAKGTASKENSGRRSRDSVGGGAQRPRVARVACTGWSTRAVPAAKRANDDPAAADQPSTDAPRTRKRAAARSRERHPAPPRHLRICQCPRRRAGPILQIGRNASISCDLPGFRRHISTDLAQTAQKRGCRQPRRTTSRHRRLAPRHPRARRESAHFVAVGHLGVHRREFRLNHEKSAVHSSRARFLQTARCTLSYPRHKNEPPTRLKFGQTTSRGFEAGV